MQEPSFLGKVGGTLRWLPAYGWQRLARAGRKPTHVIVALADHFEPSIDPVLEDAVTPLNVQESRLERWCREYPRVAQEWRDSDGRPFPHTYFYPAEQYHAALVERLAEHCREGWGEIEIHLHHGRPEPDTAANTRETLVRFRDALADRHGCLSLWDGEGSPRYAFVHGNWALANSAGGRFCGVDGELKILADTGCYADFTLPSAPNLAQVPKINAIYECARPLEERAAHRRGRDLQVGEPPTRFPIIVQGPLGLDFSRGGARRMIPYIDNGAVAASYPPTRRRLRLWQTAAIGVGGRPDWLFVKLHCHGMDPRDEEVMLGAGFSRFLELLVADAEASGARLHFTTAREMTNIILAACDGREGSPGAYRDYRLRLVGEGVRDAVLLESARPRAAHGA